MTIIRPGQRVVHIPGIGISTSRRAVSVGGFAGTNFFTVPYTGTRNDFTGQVGYSMRPASAFTIVALGRSVSTAIAGSHTVRLWRQSTGLLEASAVITGASPVDALGYAYELLGTPFTVTSDAVYYLTSTEASGGDKWRDSGSLASHSALSSIITGVYNSNLSTWAGMSTYGAANTGYVPTTFFT